MSTLEKFSTVVDPELADKLRALAAKEGKKIQSLIKEAIEDLLESREQGKPRSQVMDYFEQSTKRYSGIYKHLAK